MKNQLNIHITRPFALRTGGFILLLLVSFQMAFGQIEERNEEENDSTLFLDSLVMVHQSVTVDSVFNYNIDSSLVNNHSIIRCGLLYDVVTNTVVWQKDMNYAYPIASVTKIMTGLLTIKAIETGAVCWEDEIEVKAKYYKGRGRKKRAYYTTNTYTLRDLLKMAMIESNNYASNLLGQYVGGGDMRTFVNAMNEQAVKLKMKSTFLNPSGLPAPRYEIDNNSSPHDLLLLALEAMKYPELVGIASMGYADVHNGKSSYSIRNHNSLVRDFKGEIDGLKTGFTRAAGFCIVVSANRYNHRLISIILGAPSTWSRNALAAEMLSKYYQKNNLGVLGTRLPDSLLAVVKPGLTNEQFNYYDKKTAQENPIYAPDSNSQIVFKTVYQKTIKNHKVRSGETLSGISERYDCTVNELKKWNRLKSSKVLKGQTLKVHATIKKVVPVVVEKNSLAVADSSSKNYITTIDTVKKSTSDSVAATKTEKPKQTAKTQQPKVKSNYVIYVVQPGDTLWNIAQRYNGVTVTDLKKCNKTINAKSLLPGTKVKVPVNP